MRPPVELSTGFTLVIYIARLIWVRIGISVSFCEYDNEQCEVCVSHGRSIKIIIFLGCGTVQFGIVRVSRPDICYACNKERNIGAVVAAIIMGGRVTHVITHIKPTIYELVHSFQSTARPVEDDRV
jgi:hypothetical protein